MTSIGRILADLRLFGRGYFRNGISLFFGLAFPVILILIFGAIFSGGFSGPTTVYVQNNDNGPVSSSFISALNSTGTVSLQVVSPSQNFTQYLSAHSSSDGIVIPADFSMSYEAKIPVNVTVYGNPTTSSSQIVTATVSGVINAFNLQRVNGTSILGINPTTVHAYSYIDFLVPGLIGFAILISPMFSLVNICSTYKKDKLFKHLSLTPLTKAEWLISKILWFTFMTVLSFILMTAVGIFLFNASINFTLWLVPFLILGPLLFASLGMLVGTVASTVETAAVIGNVITFPMMFLSGTFFPVSFMPTYLQNIAHVLPLFYIIEGLNAAMIYSNFTQVAIDIAVTVVIAAVFFVLAITLFKWRED